MVCQTTVLAFVLRAIWKKSDCAAATPEKSRLVVCCPLVEIEFMSATIITECQTLDVTSSATELGVCKETVRRLVRRKVLRKLPGLRRILIPRAEVQRYLEVGEGGLTTKTLSKSGPEVAQKKSAFA